MRVSEYIIAKGGAGVLENVIQKTLNPRLWDQTRVPPRMKPEVRKMLLEIAQDFVASVDAHDFSPSDIVVTGSNANYNWTAVSDIDLHVLADFKKFGEDLGLVAEYFRNLALIWNTNHQIDFYGHEIEVYIQSITEPHVASGVYSILHDKWRVRPAVEPEPDMTAASQKAAVLTRKTKELDRMVRRGEYQKALPLIQALREKIRNMRREGLKRDGEFAPENLAFKLLRRNGSLEILRDATRLAYDRAHSLSEVHLTARSFLQELALLG